MTPSDRRAAVRYLLAELAAHPGGVAEALAMLGCRGGHGTCDCPVSVYLQRHGVAAAYPDDKRPVVGNRVVGLGSGVAIGIQWRVVDFIAAFDRGKHPELEL